MKTIDVIVTYTTDILQTGVYYCSNDLDSIVSIMKLSGYGKEDPKPFAFGSYPGCYGSIFAQNPYLKKVIADGIGFYVRSAYDTASNVGIETDEETDILAKYLSGEIKDLTLHPEISKYIKPVVESNAFLFNVEMYRPTYKIGVKF